MGYRKTIPVEINKIVIGEKYYTCSWTGVIAVIVLKVYQNTNRGITINTLIKQNCSLRQLTTSTSRLIYLKKLDRLSVKDSMMHRSKIHSDN